MTNAAALLARRSPAPKGRFSRVPKFRTAAYEECFPCFTSAHENVYVALKRAAVGCACKWGRVVASRTVTIKDVAREAKLSPVLYEWLRQYWSKERPPLPYLFASPRTGKLPGADTVRKALARAAKEAWVKKRVTPHVLRHSFATHLLDEGTDVHVVRALLGHARIDTTARYARVTQKRVRETPSPLDLLPQRR